jgi:hypothetical protein
VYEKLNFKIFNPNILIKIGYVALFNLQTTQEISYAKKEITGMCGEVTENNKFQTLELFQFLGSFAKVRKATISFIMSDRLSVPVEQLGSNWRDFH